MALWLYTKLHSIHVSSAWQAWLCWPLKRKKSEFVGVHFYPRQIGCNSTTIVFDIHRKNRKRFPGQINSQIMKRECICNLLQKWFLCLKVYNGIKNKLEHFNFGKYNKIQNSNKGLILNVNTCSMKLSKSNN